MSRILRPPALLAALVIAIGFGALGAPPAHAVPTNLVAISPIMLWSVLGPSALDGISTTDVAVLAGELGDPDGALEASDLAVRDLDANQLDEDGDVNAGNGNLLLFVFVDDDDYVTVDPKGAINTNDTFDGLSPTNTDAGADWLCDTEDEDCDGDGTPGDGVVVTYLYSNGSGTPGQTVVVDVVQEAVVLSVPIQLVGNPDEIVVSELKHIASVENEGCASADYTEGPDNDLDGDKIFLWAEVFDSAGAALTMIPVNWSVDAPSVADIVDDSGVTLEAGTVAAFAVLCGQEETGQVVVTASFDDSSNGGEFESDSVTKTVVGLPAAVTLTASPALIECNGVNSSTVTATVTDADGNNVVDGTPVRFDVALTAGQANPIVAFTVEGQASSTITPIPGVTAVVVQVTAGDAVVSIRIDCRVSLNPGDVNGDGRVDAVDALFILQCVVGLPPGSGMAFCTQGGP